MIPRFDGPVVFDSEALSRAVAKDPYLTEVIEVAKANVMPVVISAATIIEVTQPGVKLAALRWTVSRLRVEPVTRKIADNASALLLEAGLSWHRHAMDAMVCATALSLPGRATIYTSDPHDIEKLVDKKADVIPLR